MYVYVYKIYADNSSLARYMCMYIYMYIYIYIHLIYIYTHTYISTCSISEVQSAHIQFGRATTAAKQASEPPSEVAEAFVVYDLWKVWSLGLFFSILLLVLGFGV